MRQVWVWSMRLSKERELFPVNNAIPKVAFVVTNMKFIMSNAAIALGQPWSCFARRSRGRYIFLHIVADPNRFHVVLFDRWVYVITTIRQP